ncbi:class I tRNA ligase family protein [Nocardia sp. NPDC101769]|uniref:class I tRNA ligase family protein n=1 Tax=Nocardia sp. NPDC101769 TaxID=3364333 RepID=UPI0037F81228
MTGPVIIITPAPTANGDMHLGHIAGPFLAADVCARYVRATGRAALLGTGVQDTSTFVVTTARRLGTTPDALVRRAAKEIEATLDALAIQVDGFTGWEDRFLSFVREVVGELWEQGRIVLRPMVFPYAPRTGEFLVDGHIAGACPVCLADSCGGLCETCGHPVPANELRNPRSTRDPEEAVEFRTVEVLVLPLEQYRGRLRAHFDHVATMLRPRAAQLIDELLGKPLVDFPVTYPSSWGIPAPGLPGQVVNPNAEPVAWTLYCSMLAAESAGHSPASEHELWLPQAGSELVYFLGADNLYPFAIAGLGMLAAYRPECLFPTRLFTNEFYELDREKFSTSRGHLVWARDLAAQAPRDLIRFHLATDSPELQRSSFSRTELARLTRIRLVEPWNRVAERVNGLSGSGPLPVSARAQSDAARIAERFRAAYELPRFSLQRAATTITQQLHRLTDPALDGGDLCHQTEVVLRYAAPILVDLATALPDTGLTGITIRDSVEPLRLPLLSPLES